MVVDESSHFPSWHLVADSRNTAGTSRRGSPVHSLAITHSLFAHLPSYEYRIFVYVDR